LFITNHRKQKHIKKDYLMKYTNEEVDEIFKDTMELAYLLWKTIPNKTKSFVSLAAAQHLFAMMAVQMCVTKQGFQEGAGYAFEVCKAIKERAE